MREDAIISCAINNDAGSCMAFLQESVKSCKFGLHGDMPWCNWDIGNGESWALRYFYPVSMHYNCKLLWAPCDPVLITVFYTAGAIWTLLLNHEQDLYFYLPSKSCYCHCLPTSSRSQKTQYGEWRQLSCLSVPWNAKHPLCPVRCVGCILSKQC